LVGAGLSVINLLFGERDGQDDAAVRAALQATLQGFQSQTFAAEIKTHTDTLTTAANWLSTNSQTLIDLGDSDGSAFAQGLLAQMLSVNSPTSGLPIALTGLNDAQLLNDPKVGPQAYQALMFGVGLYLTYLRLAVQMQAWLAAGKSADSNAADLMYGNFDDFRQYTQQWCSTVQSLIGGYEDARLGQVGPVVQSRDLSSPISYGSQPKELEWWFNFKDSGPRPPAAGSPPVKGWSGHDQGPASDPVSSLSFQGKANAERDAYCAQVRAVLDESYGSDAQAVASWIDNLQAWQQSITPRTPPAPSLADVAWGAATPQGANWVSGATVSYALVWANSAGQSPVSPWSAPIVIDSQAFPTLTLPIDPLGLASARHVHRQFSNGAAAVFIVADNTTATWQDTNP
jgi:hypothetical protein